MNMAENAKPDATIARLISLGCQCNVPHGMCRANVRSEAFPFDRILSFLPEVRRLLGLVLDCQVDEAGNLVGTEFFKDLERSVMDPAKLESYRTEPHGPCFTDARKLLTFPHDDNIDKSVEQYRRRFERLKEALEGARLCEENGLPAVAPVVLVYSDPGSPNVAYSYNGVELTRTAEAYDELKRIADDLDARGIVYRMVYVTYVSAEKETRMAEPDPRIQVYRFNAADHWFAASDGVYGALMHLQQMLDTWWPGRGIMYKPGCGTGNF